MTNPMMPPAVPRVEFDGQVDPEYLRDRLAELLPIHSPTGYTDPIVRHVCTELENLGINYELTRRGAVRAIIPGIHEGVGRAVVSHVDTLGAMVRELKPNGRVGLKPIGTWSSRFAEGARVSLFTDATVLRGTILPAKASGHIFNEEVDRQETSWDAVELRVDEAASNQQDLIHLGINVGDIIGIDSQPEFLLSGFINARHLDDKAGVATVLAAAKVLVKDTSLPVDLHLLFTISEEVGSGASAIFCGNVAEMVSVDNGTVGPGQQSSELWPSVCMGDSSGPFDFHLSRHLLSLCREHRLLHGRDVFRYYRCDSASAVEAGNDLQTALVTFGVDASHGYERTHFDCLYRTAQLLVAYARSTPLYPLENELLGSIDQFPETRETPAPDLPPDAFAGEGVGEEDPKGTNRDG